MDRRRFLLTSLAGALAAPFSANAQQARGMYRIGFLPFSTCSVPESFGQHSTVLATLRAEMS
jgi:hypothetical protein